MIKNAKKMAMILIIMMVGSFIAGCTQKSDAEQESFIKIGFIYNGEPADFGWSYAIDQGRKYINSNVEGIETDYSVALESEPEKVRQAMIDYAEQGYDIVFSTSAGYLDTAIEVKKSYPDLTMVHTQAVRAEGVTTIMPKFYEAKYLSGLVGGLMTKSNSIGYVNSYKFPGSIMWVNGFAQGIKDVNPDAKIYLKWAQTWDDPEIERNIALDMISEYDVDILAQEQNSPTIPQVAENNGRYGFGEYADMQSFAPDAVLTSPLLNWGTFYKMVINEYRAGTLKSDLYWLSMSESDEDAKMTDIASISDIVPVEIKNQVMAKRQSILDGTFNPFEEINTVEDIEDIDLLDNIVELE